ncbi:hypothetical protein MVEN_01162500 [Mycena venus]|uniref:Uncharacterized protein n=1 Tax=Mycena venus TaxID=2733690 RepID=A0A8H7CYF1_9AGAR|nr:hypothetical protein MVEN_01162500 [Mycena venus]
MLTPSRGSTSLVPPLRSFSISVFLPIADDSRPRTTFGIQIPTSSLVMRASYAWFLSASAFHSLFDGSKSPADLPAIFPTEMLSMTHSNLDRLILLRIRFAFDTDTASCDDGCDRLFTATATYRRHPSASGCPVLRVHEGVRECKTRRLPICHGHGGSLLLRWISWRRSWT